MLCIVAAAHLASFSAGAGMAYPSVLLHQLKKEDSSIHMDMETASWMGAIHGVAGIPNIIMPIIIQWKGRKLTFMGACLLTVIGWTLAYFANSIAMILISESLHGFSGNVLLAVSYDCLSEMITPTYRNVAVQSYSVINALGIATVGIMANLLYWRTVSLIMCVPAALAIVISCAWLESPLWLAYKGELDKCERVFTKLRGTDDLSINELKNLMDAQHEVQSRREKAIKGDMFKRFWRQVKSRDFILPALYILVLLNHAYWGGGVVVILYSIELIRKATQNESAAFIGAIVMNFVLVTGMTVSSILIRYYKNKSVLLSSTCASTVCLAGVCLVTYLQSIGAVPKDSLLFLFLAIGFIISASIGQLSVVFTMAAELMPVKFRGIGGALFVIYICSLHTSALKISPYLFVYLGLWGTFLIYTLNTIICGLIIWKCVPETKGRTLLEIEHFYLYGTFEVNLLSKDETEPIALEEL